ncbi:hypothetical protein CR513_19072, partial [Mucuna pruriens]
MGDLLMVRSLMSSLVGEKAKTQRETIFHSRCLVLSKLFSLIIDGESSVNVVILRLVKKLALLLYPILGLTNVVSMEATHILLGRPCQYDRKVTHDRVTNRFSFVHMEKR